MKKTITSLFFLIIFCWPSYSQQEFSDSTLFDSGNVSSNSAKLYVTGDYPVEVLVYIEEKIFWEKEIVIPGSHPINLKIFKSNGDRAKVVLRIISHDKSHDEIELEPKMRYLIGVDEATGRYYFKNLTRP